MNLAPPGSHVSAVFTYRRRCGLGRKVADLKIYLFSATIQDRAGPSPESRRGLFINCGTAVHTVRRNWISGLGDTLCPLLDYVTGMSRN